MFIRGFSAVVLTMAMVACQTAPTPTVPPPNTSVPTKPIAAPTTAAAKPSEKPASKPEEKPAARPAEKEAVKTVTLGSVSYNAHGTRDVTGKDETSLEADSFYFEPTFLRGTPGQKIKVEVENESSIPHNVSLDAQKIDKDIPARGKTTVEVTFPPSGVIRFYCKFHAGQGMNGELLSGQATPQAAP